MNQQPPTPFWLNEPSAPPGSCPKEFIIPGIVPKRVNTEPNAVVVVVIFDKSLVLIPDVTLIKDCIICGMLALIASIIFGTLSAILVIYAVILEVLFPPLRFPGLMEDIKVPTISKIDVNKGRIGTIFSICAGVT